MKTCLQFPERSKIVTASEFAEMEAVTWIKIWETREEHCSKKCCLINILNIKMMIPSKILWTWVGKRLRNFKWDNALELFLLYYLLVASFKKYVKKIVDKVCLN